MVFECEGTRYDTCEMDRIDTDARHEQAVYITRDLSRVFVQTWDDSEGVHIHEADDAKIGLLWQTYGIAQLLRVLAVAGREPPAGPCRHVPTRS
jgi:hypothetical protein